MVKDAVEESSGQENPNSRAGNGLVHSEEHVVRRRRQSGARGRSGSDLVHIRKGDLHRGSDFEADETLALLKGVGGVRGAHQVDLHSGCQHHRNRDGDGERLIISDLLWRNRDRWAYLILCSAEIRGRKTFHSQLGWVVGIEHVELVRVTPSYEYPSILPNAKHHYFVETQGCFQFTAPCLKKDL
jgi:hypothetical protein